MNSFSNEKGFTLLEALFAMLIMAVGIMAMAQMQTKAVEGNTTSNIMTIANTAGCDGYERMLLSDYDDTIMGTTGTHTATYGLPSHVSSVTWTVTEWTNSDGVDNDGDGTTDEDDEIGIKYVTLTINYTNNPQPLIVNFIKSEML